MSLICAVLVLFLLWLFCIRGRGRHPLWETLSRYRYAHRGFHDKPTVPENSMAAFRRAVDHGWGAELDIHLMADGTLAVIHDSSLKRTAHADVCIEDLKKEDLDRYTLEDSQEKIPLFEDVLALFENTAPLIIELKAERGNAAALSAAAWEILKNYRGLYCIESFDPRVVAWFRRNAPEVMRGQLATNFFHGDADLHPVTKFLLTHLLMNFLGVPDFIAYEWKERSTPSLFLSKRLFGTKEASWTIREKSVLLAAEQQHSLPIFETFDPEA